MENFSSSTFTREERKRVRSKRSLQRDKQNVYALDRRSRPAIGGQTYHALLNWLWNCSNYLLTWCAVLRGVVAMGCEAPSAHLQQTAAGSRSFRDGGDGGVSSGNGAAGGHTPLATLSSIHYIARQHESFGRQQRVYFRGLGCKSSSCTLRFYTLLPLAFGQQSCRCFNLITCCPFLVLLCRSFRPRSTALCS